MSAFNNALLNYYSRQLNYVKILGAPLYVGIPDLCPTLDQSIVV